MKIEYMQAFAEVNEIIKLMPNELVNKIPNKFRKMIEEERDKQYNCNIKEPLEEQKLKNETIVLLGLIYRDFLCLPEERKKLQEKDARELKEMQQQLEEIRQKYNADDIFKSKIKEQRHQQENSLIVAGEKWYTKIFNIIKNIFRNNTK